MGYVVTTIDRLPPDTVEAILHGANRILCPACDGGRTRELSVSVRGGDVDPSFPDIPKVELYCWRASCGFRGRVFLDANAKIDRTTIPTANVFREELYTIDPDSELGLTLTNKYGIRQSTWVSHGWKTTRFAPVKLVSPVLNWGGAQLGVITRQFTTPKRVCKHKETAQVFVDMWTADPSVYAPVIIVEDVLSAARAYQAGYNAIALLGTSLPLDTMRHISAVYGGTKFLALDRDAFDVAVGYAKRYSGSHDIRVVCLDRDIKDMESDIEIRNLIETAARWKKTS